MGMAALLLLVMQWDREIGRLGDEDPAVREEATAALRRAGMKAADALMRVRRSPDSEVRLRACLLIEELAEKLPPDAVQVTLEFADGRAVLRATNRSPLPVRVASRVLEPGETMNAPAPWLAPEETGGVWIRPRVGRFVGEPVRVRVAAGGKLAVYALKNCRAADMARTLRALFEPGRGGAEEVRVESDERTNSIIVEADPEHHGIVAEVVRQLDVGK